MSSPSRPASQPIEVNFNVAIDASGNLTVFSKEGPQVENVIVAEHKLPVTALYNLSNLTGLLELWEPSNSQGDINVQLADSIRSTTGGIDLSGAYQTSAKALVTGLEAILCDTFDCSGATPFSNPIYKSNHNYYKQRDFGRVALATYAHYMFGHVDATAAITNDKAFVEAMLSLNNAGDSEDAETRALAYKKTAYLTQRVQDWDATGTKQDANLAIRLVKTLVQKGLSDTTSSAIPIVSNVNANDPDTLANIVAQVVGQDATRLMNVDNSERTRDQHILLRFYAGDVIYMNIKLLKPNITVGTGQLVNKTTLENMFLQEENFTIKITLVDPPAGVDPPDGVDPPVVGDTNIRYDPNDPTRVIGYNGTPPGGSLIIPEGVISIADMAFTGMSQITSVTFPSSLTTIGDDAFSFTGLTSVTLPSTITSIGDSAFFLCSSLTSIGPFYSTTTYGNYIFVGAGITSHPNLDVFTHIPDGMFYDCTGLTSLTLPSTITSIGNAAFRGCTGLISVTIPTSVISIGTDAFRDCTGLMGVTIPSSVTSIGPFAFTSCTSLIGVTIPSSITTIQLGTFLSCISLTNVTIPSSVTLIENLAFVGCSALTTIAIPETCIVQPNAFDTNITTITYY